MISWRRFVDALRRLDPDVARQEAKADAMIRLAALGPAPREPAGWELATRTDDESWR